MRRASLAVAFALSATLLSLPPARAQQTERPLGDAPVIVSAARVEFYSDLSTVVAEGNVAVTLPDGAHVTGDLFQMDLRLHRVVVAGHVHLQGGDATVAGAVLADFLSYGRVYFVPLEPRVDRWTYLDGDYAHPAKGREMPGDAFTLTDVSGTRPYVIGTHAIIDPNAFARFAPAAVNVLGVVPTPRLPAFVDNFSSDSSFGQNSLPGATLDAPYPFYGSAHTLDALHIRYDQNLPVKTYGAYEHHTVFDDQGYAVFSLAPFTQPQKQWNLLGYAPAGPNGAFALETQLFTTQSGFAAPSSSSGFVDVRWLHALRESSLLVDLTNSYDSFLATGPPNHPVVAGLTWSSFEHRAFGSGFTLRLESGAAAVHDALGVSGGTRTTVDTQHVRAILATPVYAGPWRTSINASFIAQRTWLSFPNRIDTTTGTVSASKPIAERVYTTLSASVAALDATNTTGTIVSPNIASGLAPAPASPNGLPVFGVPSSYARTTARTYSVTTSWQPSPEFQAALGVQKSEYSPVQLPAPYQATATLRARVSKSLYLGLARSYSFGFNGLRWSPQFVIQLTGQ